MVKILAGIIICIGSWVTTVAQPLTYHLQVAPIIGANCSPCHRPNGSAPFPLTNYTEVQKHARMIRLMVETDQMPPWQADSSYRAHANSRQLTAKEKKSIIDWIDAGSPEGDQTHYRYEDFLPPNTLLDPEITLQLPAPIAIPGDNREVFAWVKYPFELDSEATVSAMVFQPGDPKRVHHANIMVYAADAEAELDAGKNTWFDGWDEGDPEEVLGLQNKSGTDPKLVFVDGWVPGVTPRAFPSHTGFRLPKRGWIVLQTIHYGLAPLPTTDHSSIQIWLKEGDFEPLKIGIIGSASQHPVKPELVIPANEVSTFRAEMEVEDTMKIHEILGHMHLLGKSFKAWATSPSGTEIPLLYIPDWDFNWQEFYRFDPPQILVPGSIIHIEGVFDNTADNPNNPHNPPKTVFSQGNMETRDEMLQLIVRFTN